MTDTINALKEKFDENQLLFNEPMKKHTSFKIGGNADILVLPKSTEEIKYLVRLFGENKINYYVMGNGTNLLVSDKGFRGAVIKLFKNFSHISANGNVITAQSGALLSKIAALALKNSLSGFEFASGIPGCLGGAVCMNAGAYGGEMKDILKNITVLDKGEIIKIPTDKAGLEYRSSRILKEKMLVLEAEIELKKGNADEISALMAELKAKRNEKQPVELPGAGSTFKRPEGYFAGKLIMDAGLRGFSVGGAQISEKHCGFVVNKGGATCNDVLTLCDRVSDIVYEKFGVRLEKEIQVIGEL